MAQVMINGILIGALYAMVAVGLTVVFGVMRIINFAQGELLMIGMYVTLALFNLFGMKSTPYPLLILVAVIMFVFGAVIFRGVINRVVGKGDSNYIILTLGLSYLIQNLIQFFVGAEFHMLNVSQALKQGTIKVGGLIFSLPRLIAFGCAIICVILITFFLEKTDMGRAMRATSENRVIATILGVNTKSIYTIAFGIGTVFAGISGLLMSPMFMVHPRAGVLLSTIGMTVIVLGGLGNIKGAMIGGLLIGLVESFASVYLSLELSPIAIDFTLLLVLMLRPQGLFGKGVRSA
jgi:branched-chain amino acid transport system permease protein